MKSRHVDGAREYVFRIQDVPIRLEVKSYIPPDHPGYGYQWSPAQLTMVAHYDGDEAFFEGMRGEDDSPRKAVKALMENMIERWKARNDKDAKAS